MNINELKIDVLKLIFEIEDEALLKEVKNLIESHKYKS